MDLPPCNVAMQSSTGPSGSWTQSSLGDTFQKSQLCVTPWSLTPPNQAGQGQKFFFNKGFKPSSVGQKVQAWHDSYTTAPSGTRLKFPILRSYPLPSNSEEMSKPSGSKSEVGALAMHSKCGRSVLFPKSHSFVTVWVSTKSFPRK